METWLITGSNRGIGLHLAQQALHNGYTVIAACRNPDGARSLWELESDYPNKLTLLKLDISDPESIAELPKQVSAESIDVLINNAAIQSDPGGPCDSLSQQNMNKVFNVNSTGPALVCNALKSKIVSAKIIQISSDWGSIEDTGATDYLAYRMSKAALNMYSRVLSLELPKAICTSLHPGWVRTDMGGPEADITPLECSQKIVSAIKKLTPEHTGMFLNYEMQEMKW